MANKQMTVIINGKEYVSKETTKAGKGLSSLEKKVKSAKATFSKFALVAGSITAVVLAVKNLTDAYSNQIKADEKLSSALQATKGAVGLTKGELAGMATEMSRLTGIADEAITEAQALMVTFTQIGAEVFPDAISAAADMSAMFGQDLQQSVIQLGTALNDPIAGVGRLKRIGISFTQDQKNMIEGFMEQNDIMSAQKVILDELNAEFGGVAENMGQTWPQKAQRFHNAITDGKEILGEYITEGIDPVITKLTEFIEKAADARKAQKGFNDVWSDEGADNISDYEQALVEAQNRIDNITDKISDLKDKLEDANGLRANRLTKDLEEQEKLLKFAMADWDSIYRILQAVKEVNDAYNEKSQERAAAAERILKLEEEIDAVIQEYGDKQQQEIEILQAQIDRLVEYQAELENSGEDTTAVYQAINLLIAEQNKLLEEQNKLTNNQIKDLERQKKNQELINTPARELDRLLSEAEETYKEQILVMEQIPELLDMISEAETAGDELWLEHLNEILARMYEIAGIDINKDTDTTPTKANAWDSFAESSDYENSEIATVAESVDGVLAQMDLFTNGLAGMIGSLSSVQAILNPITVILQGMMSILEPVINDILAPVLGILRIIGQFLGSLIAPILQWLSPIIEAVGNAFVWLYNNIFVPIGNLLITLFNGVYNTIAWVMNVMIEAINWALGWLGVNIAKVKTKSLTEGTMSAIDFGDLVSSGYDATGDYTDYTEDSTGSSTSITRVPDIYLYQTFNGPIIGAGGMEEFGEFTVEAIQAYVGVGGSLFIEGD